MSAIGTVRALTFTDSQGFKLYAEQWLPTTLPVTKGFVQIAHGMRESTEYYVDFIEALLFAGYGVYIHDARGHGRSAGEAGSHKFFENAGYVGDGGINQMVDDLKLLTDIIKDNHPGFPVFLLGHSMGSVLSRVYAYKYGGELDGLLYSGTTGPVNMEKNSSLLEFATNELNQRGKLAPAVDTPNQLFGNFNDRFPQGLTGREYMSRDEKMVEKAIQSPYSEIPYRCGFYVDFLRAMRDMDSEVHLESIPKNLPIFSVSGSMDPFGEYGEGVPRLFKLYSKFGFSDAHFIVYEGGRHEMLREINRETVFADIIKWLDRHYATKTTN
jgi:alpha-beta hydrolase superfamily lysophospholipase